MGEDSSCPGRCGQASYKGDGNCDDENNNCGCGDDGGDCCGSNVKKKYCKQCKCLDPNFKKDGSCSGKCGSGYDGGDFCGSNVKTTYCKQCKCLDPNFKKKGSCSGKCGLPKYKGDGNCDDENNNCGCGYDGGDCCGSNVKTTYCKQCKCLDPNFKKNGSCSGKCGLPKYKGDGNCDDENNNCGCGYDGGDCCGSDVKTT